MKVAVIIPTFRASRTITAVISEIPAVVDTIYVVDDCCPESSGEVVKARSQDPRVRVLTHESNVGVGGAMATGFEAALRDNIDVIVKIDSDGQMDSRLIPWLITPILEGRADFTKGNRFFDFESLRSMPRIRLIGNTCLSLINKFSSGYWDVMDPTNGFFAIHTNLLRFIPLSRIDRGFFFESDLLFRLGTIRARVLDIPMRSRYPEGGISNLSVLTAAITFPYKFASRVMKRLLYNYFVRGVSVGSFALVIGAVALTWGTIFGVMHWYESIVTGKVASSGTVMLAGLPVILGVIAILVFLVVDSLNTPTKAIYKDLPTLSGRL